MRRAGVLVEPGWVSTYESPPFRAAVKTAALLIYGLAAQSDRDPAEVSDAEIRAVVAESPDRVRGQLQVQLIASGHDLRDGADMVARLWRDLHSEPSAGVFEAAEHDNTASPIAMWATGVMVVRSLAARPAP